MNRISASAPAAPRRYRRFLIVLVAILGPLAVHAIWDQVEVILLTRQIAEIARRGEPVNTTSRRYPLPVGELRRSAALYAAAADLARWQGETYAYKFERTDLEDSSTPLDETQLTAYLADSEAPLHLLTLATPLDFREFSYYAPELYTNESSLESLNTMNCLNADVLSLRGAGDAAADVLLRSVRLQRTMPIPFYRRISTRRLYGSLRILLNHTQPGGESLRRLQAAFEEWPDEDGIAAEIQRRRAQLLSEYWPHPTDGASWAYRLNPPRGLSGPAAVAFWVLRPWMTHAVRRELGPFDEALGVARESWPRKADSVRALERRHREPRSPGMARRSTIERMLGILPPGIAMYSFGDLAAGGTTLAMRRTAIAVLAIERYRRDHAGEFPASLRALVPAYLPLVPDDPFSGRSMVLKLEPDAYVVYSVDVDRRDDGGALYGVGTGTKERGRENYATPHDIGIRVRRHVN